MLLYCGMLNCSYNLGMRHLKGCIPEHPVGTAEDIAAMIADFVPIARAVIGVFAIPEMVLIQKRYPHRRAAAWARRYVR